MQVKKNLWTLHYSFFDLLYIILKFAKRLSFKTWPLTDFMSPEVYSTYVIEDGEVNKEAMKENNLLDYESQYSTSVQIKVKFKANLLKIQYEKIELK